MPWKRASLGIYMLQDDRNTLAPLVGPPTLFK